MLTSRIFRPVAALALAGAVLLGAAPAAAAGQVRPLTPPPETAAGSFSGTWSRIDPTNRMAVHIRRGTDERAWEVRLQWMTDTGLVIDTDWGGKAEFIADGYPGSIELEVDQRRSTDDRIVARWAREQEGRRSSKLTESGELVLFRTGRSGLELVWLQEDLQRTVEIREPILPEEEEIEPRTDRVQLQFLKQSVRVLRWDEIYW